MRTAAVFGPNFRARYRLSTYGYRKTVGFLKIAYISFDMGIQYTNQPKSASSIDIFNLFDAKFTFFFFFFFPFFLLRYANLCFSSVLINFVNTALTSYIKQSEFCGLFPRSHSETIQSTFVAFCALHFFILFSLTCLLNIYSIQVHPAFLLYSFTLVPDEILSFCYSCCSCSYSRAWPNQHGSR
jgi:hypothetical protein